MVRYAALDMFGTKLIANAHVGIFEKCFPLHQGHLIILCHLLKIKVAERHLAAIKAPFSDPSVNILWLLLKEIVF